MPSPITVSGTLYTGGNIVAANKRVRVTPIAISGSFIWSGSFYADTNDVGFVTFTAIRAGRYNISAPALQFDSDDGGMDVTLADAATQTIESLVASSSYTIAGLTLLDEGVALSELYTTINVVGSGGSIERISAGVARLNLSGGGGSGTVTSFSAGDLSPLFTTTEANPTTTPALTFSLSTQSVNRVFAGPATGADSAPTFRALVSADIPTLTPSQVGLGSVANSLQLVAANNLSDLTNAGTARSSLGLVIGTNVQAFNSNLTTYAGIAPSANVQTLLGAANYGAFRSSLTLVPGTDVQAWDADLDAIAALSGTGLAKRTGSNTWTLDTSTYATQAYADALVVGLLDDRGNFDASGNAFPSSGGSGSAGAILKGDLWTISVAGTLGGHPVTAGDVVRALADTPGQTDSNWAIGENNFGYVALNQALASGKFYVGNGSGIGTGVTPTGDVTFDNAGVFAIGATKVTNAMLAGSIAYGKLSLTGAILNADLAGSIDLTSKVTGTLPVANGGTGITSLGTGVATWLGTPSSANLLAVITDETGSGALVFGTSPTIVTPSLTTGFTIGGVAASGTIPRGNGTNFVASAFTMALPGTSGNVLTSDGTNWTSAAASGGGLTIGTTTITGGTDTKALYNNAGVVGERTVTGTGNAVLSASPTLTGIATIPTIKLALGSKPSPSIYFDVATDTGFYTPGSSAGYNWVYVNGNEEFLLGSAEMRVRSSYAFNWSVSNTAPSSNGGDLGVKKNAAGIFEINNATAGQWGGLKAGYYGSETNAVANGITIGTRSSGTPGIGLGAGLLFTIDATSSHPNENAAQIVAKWTDPTYATLVSDLVFYTRTGGAALTEGMRLTGAGNLVVAGNGTVDHIIGGTSTPGIAAGAGAGTSPTVSITGTDLGGYISVTTGTLPTGTNATVVTITFNVAYDVAPRSIVLYPANALTAGLSGVSMVYVDQAAISTTTFTVVSGTTALTAATAYKWFYSIVQ